MHPNSCHALAQNSAELSFGFIHDFLAINFQEPEVVLFGSFEFILSDFFVESFINLIAKHQELVTASNFAAQFHEDFSDEPPETNFNLMKNFVILNFISDKLESVSEFFYGTDYKARETVEDLVVHNCSSLPWLSWSLLPVSSWSSVLGLILSWHIQNQREELERFMIKRLRSWCSYNILIFVPF